MYRSGAQQFEWILKIGNSSVEKFQISFKSFTKLWIVMKVVEKICEQRINIYVLKNCWADSIHMTLKYC